MTYSYAPKGVCSSRIDLELDGDIIKSVQFTGGCHGNLQGISRLVQGMKAQDAIARLDERQRNILALRFCQGKTQMEVSSEIGISQAQVSRLEKGAIACIKREM